MIGGAPLLGLDNNLQLNKKLFEKREVPDGSVTPLDTPFVRKLHEEHAAAMAAGQNAPRPYPVAYTNEEGGTWYEFRMKNSIKFSDGSIYDVKTQSWRQESVDPIAQWERNKAADPLASSGMIQAGEHLVREVKNLRAKLLDLEMEKRGMPDDNGRDF